MQITVFTPTYNRAHLLSRIYESLKIQTFKDFEWVIVDDGSIDNTSITIEKLQLVPDKFFPIRYFYQENGGKHRAINRGVKEARGELFLILDSDDSLPAHALEYINKHYQQIRDDLSFGGVCGYMAHHDGTIIGHGNDAAVLDANSIDMRFRYGIQGDMCEVFRTDILKEIPFPEIPGEKFVPEALVWNRIARKYRLRIFHEVVYYRDYLDGGLTDKIVKIRMQSPIASMMTYAEMTNFDIPFHSKVKAAVNYWRFRMCAKRFLVFGSCFLGKKDKTGDIPKLKWWWGWTMPLGWLMHLRDIR